MTTDLQDLRHVASADVYKSGVLAARLERVPGGRVRFEYLDAYRTRPAAEPIASTLPLDADPRETPSGSVPAFFAGLLPEGHRLTVLQRAVKTSASDELSLLLAVGQDMPGDVQIVPAGEPATDVPSQVGDDAPGVLDFSALVGQVDAHALPGVQRKASASMISTPLATRSGRYILKLNPSEYPRLVENEMQHLMAARGLRIPVSRAAIVHDRSGASGLLVRRFDRERVDGAWRRLAFEDATQVLDVPPAAKYTTDAATASLALAGVSRAPLVALRNLYLQFLFAWLTGNGDLHAKNLGVLRDDGGRWAIAPIFDIACTLVYGDDSMALAIAGRTRRLRARHWREFAADLGLPDPAAASARRLAMSAAGAADLTTVYDEGSPLHFAQRELRMRRAELAEG